MACQNPPFLLPFPAMSTLPAASAGPEEPPSFGPLRDLFEKRIVILDGAMGSMIQTHGLE